jgi:hypothetical protein
MPSPGLRSGAGCEADRYAGGDKQRAELVLLDLEADPPA